MQAMLMLDGRHDAGGTALVMHNERLADPLDDYTREIAKISKRRNKTEADHLEIARLEFLGGLYTNSEGPCLPAWNIIRCLQDGAKRTKRGADVLRGVAPLADSANLAYEGPRETDLLWKDGGYMLRKTVGVQRSRTMRTRPIFVEWSAALPVEVDPAVFDPDTLESCWKAAGRYAGLGEMRPIYGKFLASLVTDWEVGGSVPIGQAAYALACSVASQQIAADDEGRADRYEDPNGLLTGAKRLLDKLR